MHRGRWYDLFRLQSGGAPRPGRWVMTLANQSKRFGGAAALLRCGLIALALGAPMPAAADSTEPSAKVKYFGRPLHDVLESFGEVPLVYSSTLVGERMWVVAEPKSTGPVEILGEVLAPHGLKLEEFDGTYYVVRARATQSADSPGALIVYVKKHASGGHLPGASVRLDDLNQVLVADNRGISQLYDVPPGSYRMDVAAPSYRSEQQTVTIRPGGLSVAVVSLPPAEVTLESITVTASRYDLINQLANSLAYFSREELESLPNFGEDPIHATHRLPGTASGGLSAKSHIRGGEDNETLLILDGLELLEPFHIRDFHSIFSTIDQRAISGIEMYTGGFPAAYGDHMSAVMLIDSLEPSTIQHELGLTLWNTSALSSGIIGEDRGEWLLSARRGNLDLVVDPKYGEPSYYDLFGHLGFQKSPLGRISVNAFVSHDKVLVITESDADDNESATSTTDNAQFWVRLENDFGDALSLSTVLGYSRFDNDRAGTVTDEEKIVGFVDDRREVDLFEFKQDWKWHVSERQLVKFGYYARSLSAAYDYAAAVEYDGFFDAFPGREEFDRRIDVSPDGESYGAYLSDRIRVGERLTAEAGLRWDRQTYTHTGHDDQFSPRLNLLFNLTDTTDLRASWGRFYQSQGIQELQVEDGLTEFLPAQRADHLILSLERRFPNDTLVRIEAFRKSMDRLRPRYENLFDSLALLPELQPDRVRIAPDSARAEGIELFLNHAGSGPWDWWASYSYSKVTDKIDGVRIPRAWDQRQAFNAGISWSNEKWTVSLAGNYHSGWPTTAFGVEELGLDDEGEPEIAVLLGRRNALNLASFRSLDFRVSRQFDVGLGTLKAFAEITNVLDRENPCCVDYDVEDEDGEIFIDRSVDYWLPLVPAIGLRWEF